MNAFTALLRKDWHVMLNIGRLARRQSRFKAVFIFIFAIGLLAGMWLLFLEGFRFLSSIGGIGVMIIHHMFGLFFFSLGIMLVISNITTSYTTYFRSREIPFLLVNPVSDSEIMVHKLLETSLLSSWAFFFMIIPFIGAFAWHEKLPLTFVLWTFLFSVPFVIICSSIGVIITFFAVRWFPRFRPTIWMGIAVLFCIVLVVCSFSTEIKMKTDDISFILARIVPGLKFASFPLWPSRWVSEGIMALAREQWVRGVLFLVLLSANVLFAGMLVEITGRALFFKGWQKVLSTKKRDYHQHLFSGLDSRLQFLSADIRAVIMKDIRSLMRDPVQWTQGFLFFGLLGLYFFNLRNLHYHMLAPVWRNFIAFINVFSLSAIMCSFCSRFVYPQLSLEGQAFWILELAPTTKKRILLTKFGYAFFFMLLISVFLMILSSKMLGVSKLVVLTSTMIAVAMSFALCGLATGLGAIFIDLQQSNPMAIISGFGGTLNLALSLGYMVAAILPFGFIFHWYHSERIGLTALMHGFAISVLWLLSITICATVFPLVLGKKSLVSRDY